MALRFNASWTVPEIPAPARPTELPSPQLSYLPLRFVQETEDFGFRRSRITFQVRKCLKQLLKGGLKALFLEESGMRPRRGWCCCWCKLVGG